jgi:hypothetical protein
MCCAPPPAPGLTTTAGHGSARRRRPRLCAPPPPTTLHAAAASDQSAAAVVPWSEPRRRLLLCAVPPAQPERRRTPLPASADVAAGLPCPHSCRRPPARLATTPCSERCRRLLLCAPPPALLRLPRAPPAHAQAAADVPCSTRRHGAPPVHRRQPPLRWHRPLLLRRPGVAPAPARFHSGFQ